MGLYFKDGDIGLQRESEESRMGFALHNGKLGKSVRKINSRFFPLTNTFKHNGNMNKHVYLLLLFFLHGESKVPEAIIVFDYTVPEKHRIKSYSSKFFL